MKCPNCGTHVGDDLRVCPACHASLVPTAAAGEDDVRWCESCGSAIPDGMDVCPVCAMPVNGVFDDEPIGIIDSSKDDLDSLVSAIPPDPSEAPEVPIELEGRAKHFRLVIISAIAALVVVGGTALFITRPWNPDAYVTHATEDADTSMDGFPGTVTHLTSQDRVEDAVWQAYLEDADKIMRRSFERMGSIFIDAEGLIYDTSEGFSQGDETMIHENALKASKLSSEIHEDMRSLEALILPNEVYAAERDKLMVYATYLSGEVDMLSHAWKAADEAADLTSAATEMGLVLKEGSDGRSLQELRSLFRNAYTSDEGHSQS